MLICLCNLPSRKSLHLEFIFLQVPCSLRLAPAIPYYIANSLKLLHLHRFTPPPTTKMSEPQADAAAATVPPPVPTSSYQEGAAAPSTTTTEAAPAAAPTTTEPTTTTEPAAAATETTPLYPGDAILPSADAIYDQRKTIHAAPADIWPWVVQWGKGRGGWYVPAKLEKRLPEKYRSAPAIEPKWQALRVGDKVPDYGLGSAGKKGAENREGEKCEMEVALIEPQRALVYKGVRMGVEFTWALLLEEQGAETVLHLRFRGKSQQTGWKAKVNAQIGKFSDGVMAQAIFPGIADRVEGQGKEAVKLEEA